ncbi:unnamed protein product [Gongylonema pulchrum]|uniref:Homeobox protein homothorax n=1 Tax=Gongylonema pulchrum TaxID=637853 RepID=A0A183CYJ4_9BILA|nr:unnamed protein product [Gongylonema pulchrum]
MREESAPPENELQKFGEKTPNISEHELRFRKSTEKLHVPDWYRERRTLRTTDLDTSHTSTTSERPTPCGTLVCRNISSPTYCTNASSAHPPLFVPALQTYTTATATPSGISLSHGPLPYVPHGDNNSRAATQHEVSSTRYSTPFSYEQGRCSAPLPPIRTTSFAFSTYNAPLVIPYGMFDRYRDEIEEMRRSRTSLHQTDASGDADERKVCIV